MTEFTEGEEWFLNPEFCHFVIRVFRKRVFRHIPDATFLAFYLFWVFSKTVNGHTIELTATVNGGVP